MSENLKSCLHELGFIARLRPKTRLLVLKDPALSDERYYNALKEIARNTIKRNVKIRSKRLPKKHKQNICELAVNRSKVKKRKLQIQSGGWLHYIIPAVIALLLNHDG